MLQNTTTAILVLLCVFGLNAQVLRKAHIRPQTAGLPVQAEWSPLSSGFETNAPPVVAVAPATNFFTEMEVGSTVHDRQSNNSPMARVHNWGNGKVSATWMMSVTGSEQAGFADRGTGYNQKPENGDFGVPPSARLEDVQSGWPNYFVTANGTEICISHRQISAAVGFELILLRRAAGASNWTKSILPKNTSKAGLWVRACAGGPDGNTIHLIYMTAPTNFGGDLVDGLNGTLRYLRSTDAGLNWDKVDLALPGLTSAEWRIDGIGRDAYSIDAHNNSVAIGVFGFNSDCILIKSNDNGNTWQQPRVINDFPLDKWISGDGYTFDQIAYRFNPDITPAPNGITDSLAMMTSDQTGSVLVDDAGKAHAFFPTIFIRDPDTTKDAVYTWYPRYNIGITYWNEDLPDDKGFFMANAPDLNGDNTLGNPDGEFFNYGFDGLSTFPNAGMDAEGRIYLVYTSHHDEFLVGSNIARHPFIVKSAPHDYTRWSDPVEVFARDLVADSNLIALKEHNYPILARKVDGYAHVVCQQDEESGITFDVTGNQSPSTNLMVYMALPVDRIPEPAAVATREPARTALNLRLSPNPVSGRARVSFKAAQSETAWLTVFDARGATVLNRRQAVQEGLNQIELDTQTLPNGLYQVQLRGENTVGMAKMMVGGR